MTRTRTGPKTAALLAALGLVVALTVAACGSVTPASSNGPSAYQYYQSMMGSREGGQMMGASGGSMMGQSGYTWMMGDSSAPGWMRGGSFPDAVGPGGDPGTVMGGFLADAPGPRVTTADATTLGNQAPAGAQVDVAAARIVFTTSSVHLVVVASPTMPAENFRIAGMINPAITVPAGAHVSIQLINADTDMAHGLVITSGDAAGFMPMMTAQPAFPGSALWLLGEATPAGMHTDTLTFTATTAGSYRYLCPVPGHAQEGMIGTFIVTG